MPSFKVWFIFGKHLNGRVDVSDVDGDIVTMVLPEEANRIVRDRMELLDAYEAAKIKLTRVESALNRRF